MKPTISIVYTEISVLQTLDKILTEAGFKTYPYYSPEEALAWAHIRHPDVYLINYKNIDNEWINDNFIGIIFAIISYLYTHISKNSDYKIKPN